MDCNTCRRLLDAHLDGELDLRSSLEVEDHLASCPDCTARLEAHRAVSRATRKLALRPGLSPALMARLKSAGRPHSPRMRATRALSVAALAACLALLVVGGRGWLRGSEPVEDLLVDAHVRSLQADHLFDVASTDQHTVKPWFAGKLDFSMPVADLSGQGYPLLGGRLEYLQHRAVAALVYGRRQHRINVFLWPDPSNRIELPRTLDRRGFHCIEWSEGELHYWAVSDLNTAELLAFANLMRGADH